jgi:hypothetical protein
MEFEPVPVADTWRAMEELGKLECIHCKKKLAIFPSPARPAWMLQTRLSLAGNGKIANLFLQCSFVLVS